MRRLLHDTLPLHLLRLFIWPALAS